MLTPAIRGATVTFPSNNHNHPTTMDANILRKAGVVAVGWHGNGDKTLVCDDPSHYMVAEPDDYHALADDLEQLVENAKSEWTGCDWTTDVNYGDIDADGLDISAMSAAVTFIEAHGLDWDDDTSGVTPEVCRIYQSFVEFRNEDGSSVVALACAIAAAKKAIEYAAAVQSSAEDASAFGDAAVEALRGGDITAAVYALRHASSRESEYGDDQCWSTPRKWIERLAEALVNRDDATLADIGVPVTYRLAYGLILVPRCAITGPVEVGNWSWSGGYHMPPLIVTRPPA